MGRVDGQGVRESNFPSVLDRFLDTSWVPKGSQDGAQDETLRPQDDPRGRQDGTQDDQNRSKNRLQKRSRLRTVLRPSWGDLGPILAPSWGHFWWFCFGFCNISWKSTFSKKILSRPVLAPSWADLGGQRDRLGRPWGSKLGVRRPQGLVLEGLKALKSEA